MAKAGSGKKKMQAVRQKQQRRVEQSLRKAGF